MVRIQQATDSMKPFFRYYGGKWKGSRHYGPPRRNLVIEPFAGSAGYSVYWDCENVRLYDLNEDIVDAWDWLINCSEDDVRNVPDKFQTSEEWNALPNGPRQLVFRNLTPQKTIGPGLPGWFLEWSRTGKKTGYMKDAMNPNGTFRSYAKHQWGPERKERIISQKGKIAKWTVERLSFGDIPLEEAHWHVDPPYQGKPGRGYKYNSIDYDALGKWCRELPGAADVCENAGADWLPFETLYSIQTQNSDKHSVEVVWRKDSGDLFS